MRAFKSASRRSNFSICAFVCKSLTFYLLHIVKTFRVYPLDAAHWKRLRDGLILLTLCFKLVRDQGALY